MLLEVWCVDRRILTGLSTVNHHAITDVQADMRHFIGRGIRPLKKYKVAGLCVAWRYGSTLVVNPLRVGTRQVADAGVSENVADEAGTVKTVRPRSAEYIRLS